MSSNRLLELLRRNSFRPPAHTLVGELCIDGEWLRAESDFASNDRVRVRVTGGRAVVVWAPPGATLRRGLVVWRGIASSGSLWVTGMASDGRTEERGGWLFPQGDRLLALRITGRERGKGLLQTWVRARPAGRRLRASRTSRTRVPVESVLTRRRRGAKAEHPVPLCAFAASRDVPRAKWQCAAWIPAARG